MNDKYNMSLKENIFIAKRMIIDIIWKSANLEGINITFPETYAIYEKAYLDKANISDVNTILNLKHAWQIVFSSIEEEIDLEYIKKIHNEVGKDEALEWGVLRNGTVGISGTDYIPPIPDKGQVEYELQKIKEVESVTERAITLMMWLMKSQLFWDGNKRTAMIIANKELIKNGKGIISIPIEKIKEFNELLSDYYTNDRKVALQNFIYKYALYGIKERMISDRDKNLEI